MSYAFLNKNVLISVLKLLSFGAAAVKALSPRVFFVLVTFGASNSSLFDRRQYLLCSFVLIRSLMYTGDKPWTDLNIITNFLNSILNLIGSQCSVRNTGVMCPNRGNQPGSRILHTLYSFFIYLSGNPKSKLLQ